MTFEQIVAIEPKFGDVVNGLRPGANKYDDYEKAKRKLHSLVGTFCDNPRLQSVLVHNAVIRQVIDRLEI